MKISAISTMVLVSTLLVPPISVSAKSINTDSKSTIFNRSIDTGTQNAAGGISMNISGISTPTAPPKVPVKVCDSGYQYEPSYDVCAKYTDSSYVCETGYNLKGDVCEGKDIQPYSRGNSVREYDYGNEVIWRINNSIVSRSLMTTIQYGGKTYTFGKWQGYMDHGEAAYSLAILVTKAPSYSCPFGYNVYQDTCRTTKPYKIEYQ